MRSTGSDMEPVDDEMTITRFGHRPDQAAWVISIRRPPIPAVLPLPLSSPCHPSLGRLDKLPPELLYAVLDQLDFHSLSSLAATCRTSHRHINAYPPYGELRKHAPETVIALRGNEVPQLHSARSLYRALTSPSCACCGRFGAFLFLPTARRACFTCSRDCRRFRLIRPDEAEMALGLSRRSQRVPLLRIMPGRYWSGVWSNTRLKGFQLCSLEDAVEAATADPAITAASATSRKRKRDQAESAGDAGDLSRSRPEALPSLRVSKELRSLTNPDGFLDCTAGTERINDWTPNDSLGMASLAFPYLNPAKAGASGDGGCPFASSVLDSGIWCKGCWHAGHAKMTRRLTGGNKQRARKNCLQETVVRRHILDARVQPLFDAEDDFVDRFKHQERSKGEFLEHVKACPCLDFKWAWDDYPALVSLRERLMVPDLER